jgi:hypothetical protein
LPWTEVLDVACTWAGGASTADDAAQRITRTVHDLGAHLVQYDCLAVTDGPGAPHYSLLLFQCTAFLQLLRGAPGNGHLVNCSDCATVVSTFANALGCDLWQSTMGFNFVLNPTRSIGFDVWLNGCGFGAFTMHEVAWSGATDAADPVWDACLELNGNFNPSVPPFVPLLAVNMRFGLPGQGLYRDRLAAPAGRFNCNPLPQTRQRRPVI